MLRALWIVLSCLALGQALAQALHLPMPPSILGLLLLFAALQMGWVEEADIKPLADTLLNHLMLLLVPPCVAVMNYFDLLREYALAIIIASIVSTLFLLWFSAWLYRRVRTW